MKLVQSIQCITSLILLESCVCRVRGDPIVEKCDGQWMLLVGHKKYTLSKHLDPTDPCSFNIEIKAGKLFPGQNGITYPRYMDVEIYHYRFRLMQNGRVFVSNVH